MEPQEMARQLRKPEGEAGIAMGDQMNQGNGVMNRFVFDCVALQDGEKILEIGFGNGKLVPELLRNTANVRYCGIDYSPDMVQEAIVTNKTLVEEGICEFREGDFQNIPFPDNSFDKICTINTIYFLEKPQKGLMECLRVLRPGGKVFIGIRPRHMAKAFPFIQYGFTLYEPEEVEALLKGSCFTLTGFKNLQEAPVKFNGEEFRFKSCCIFGVKP